jgi:hypothetical protein
LKLALEADMLSSTKSRLDKLLSNDQLASSKEVGRHGHGQQGDLFNPGLYECGAKPS